MEFDEHILMKESCFIDVYHGIGISNRGRTYRGAFKRNKKSIIPYSPTKIKVIVYYKYIICQ